MSRVLATMRAHPFIATFFVVCIVGGAIAGEAYLPTSLSAIRRTLGGAVGGFGVALLSTFQRLLD